MDGRAGARVRIKSFEVVAMRRYVVALALGLPLVMWLGIGQENTGEHGFLERLQLVILISALIGYLALNIKSNPLVTPDWLPPFFGMFMALLMFTFLGRETSWLRIWDIHDFWGVKVKLIGVTMAISGLIYISWQSRNYVADSRRIIRMFLCSTYCWLVVLGSSWLLLSQLFEHEALVKSLAYHEYYEEMSELVAYLTLLYAAYHRRLIRRFC